MENPNSVPKKKSHKMEVMKRRPVIKQFILFFLISNGVTVLQLILMPVFKAIFELTSLIYTDFIIWQVGNNFDGSPYYIFEYPGGTISEGGGGGLAYFLAVQLTLTIAHIINFILQRNVTFKGTGSIWKAAFWYVVAYIVITISAAALQGLYKAPIYHYLINTRGMGGFGETLADFITMIINATIAFWVFFPILKIIFKNKKVKASSEGEAN